MASNTSVNDVKKARVSIELDGEIYELIPSPDAILTLSMKYDGLAPLMAAIARINVQAIADVIVHGLGLEGREARDMAGKVAVSPIIDSLLPKISEFAA